MRLPSLDRVLAAAGQRVLRAQLEQAQLATFPGTLTMRCACTARELVDTQLTGADLVGITAWLDAHSRHGERTITLELPAGTDTTVRIEL